MFSMVVSKSNSWVNFAILIPTTTFFCQQAGCFEEWMWLCSRNLKECRQRLLPDLKDGTSGSISKTSAHAQVLLPAIPINQMAYIVKLTSNSWTLLTWADFPHFHFASWQISNCARCWHTNLDFSSTGSCSLGRILSGTNLWAQHFVVLKVEQRETERGRLNLTRLGNQTQGWGQILRQSRYPPQFWGKQAPSSTIVVQSRTLKLHGLQKLRSMQDHQLQCKDQIV